MTSKQRKSFTSRLKDARREFQKAVEDEMAATQRRQLADIGHLPQRQYQSAVVAENAAFARTRDAMRELHAAELSIEMGFWI